MPEFCDSCRGRFFGNVYRWWRPLRGLTTGYSHAFTEPLVPVGGQTTATENQALGTAIKGFLKRGSDEDVSALTGFLAQYLTSAWRASLDLNLAEIYFKNGYFSKALDAWQDAWNTTQNLTDITGQQVANMAVAKLAKMKARIGRTDELDALFKQIKGRSISGSAAELLAEVRLTEKGMDSTQGPYTVQT